MLNLLPIKNIVKKAGRISFLFILFVFFTGKVFAEVTDPVILTEYSAPIGQIGISTIQSNSYFVGFRNLGLVRIRSLQDPAEQEAESIQSKINIWVQQYSVFEAVDVHDFPSVSNVVNGIATGIDSGHYELKNDWSGFYGAYIGYGFAHQDYGKISIYQNSGILGLRGAVFKKGFYASLVTNALYSDARGYNFFGTENFSSFATNIAAQSGYGIHFFDDKLVIQPNITAAYYFIRTFDYDSSTGTKITSSPSHSAAFTPGVKVILDLKGGWQPYGSFYYGWGYLNRTSFFADGVNLPSIHISGNSEYGVGVQKVFDEHAIGFIQTRFKSGGRQGVGICLGVTWGI